ncbi:MAG: hypothetical protein ABFD54_02295 [Armatimonadota bacterium]|nr:hypothetical protein [bacterium]
MRIFMIAVILVLSITTAQAQSWNSASSYGMLDVTWTYTAGEYIFTVLNQPDPDLGYDLLVWTLEPFQISEPLSVACPDGWNWRDDGGWQRFEVSDKSDKYTVGGPALEPGETLQFHYKVDPNKPLVNIGGPTGGSPVFLAHIGAVDGQHKGKWIAYECSNGKTWYDVPQVPEPGCMLNIFLGIFMLGCLRVKQARV